MKLTLRCLIICIVAISTLGFTFPETGSSGSSPAGYLQGQGRIMTDQILSGGIGSTIAQSSTDLDFCTLVTKADVEKFFGEPAGDPTSMPGGCAFNNKKDGLYAFSISAGQEKDSINIMQSQAMLLGMAGVKLDADAMAKIKSLAEAMDFAGFFNELVALSKSSSSITANLYTGGGNDLTYWAWITVPPRRSGAFTAVRGKTLVSMYLVVPESQKEETMLDEANKLANTVFSKLPEKFTIAAAPSSAPAQPAPTQPPATPVPQPTATPDTGLPAPVLESPYNGKIFDQGFPRNTTFTWSAVPGAKKYVLELMACSSSKPNDCFVWPKDKPKHEVFGTTYTYGFVGAQPGKWRVTAIDAKGVAGTPSGWWTFRYKK